MICRGERVDVFVGEDLQNLLNFTRTSRRTEGMLRRFCSVRRPGTLLSLSDFFAYRSIQGSKYGMVSNVQGSLQSIQLRSCGAKSAKRGSVGPQILGPMVWFYGAVPLHHSNRRELANTVEKLPHSLTLIIRGYLHHHSSTNLLARFLKRKQLDTMGHLTHGEVFHALFIDCPK